ncbi:putative reverse transcriptase domain-containing protein [Tanacetum coccineum]|uniref:Reverse transcriptase domain-containing protein n=1 Tax=Tanacetum coccineum TaxID=301880 RepID=A0ABQ5AQ20_9ASTR
MAPKRTTRSKPATPTPNEPTTTVTEAQLQALIDQGVAAAMAEAEASRVRNGYNSNGSGPRPAQTARECSYSEFLKCKPLDFKGTEGVVGLTRWFEKMESVFSISNCPAASQVKFATCNCKRCSSWATDVVALYRRFQQLALMCSVMFPEEVDKIEKYIGGLPDMILGSVKAFKSKTMQKQKGKERMMIFPRTIKTNRIDADTARTTMRHSELKSYAGSKPLCSRCNCHHEAGPCPPRAMVFDVGVSRPLKKKSAQKLNNNDCGNQAGNDRAPAKVYAVGNAGANPDNVVAGTFLLNNRYAYILFDTGADRSFVSTAFSTLLDIVYQILSREAKTHY